MKNYILLFAFIFIISGCASQRANGSLQVSEPLGTTIWWGTKVEIVDFLASPDAKAEKWIIQAIE